MSSERDCDCLCFGGGCGWSDGDDLRSFQCLLLMWQTQTNIIDVAVCMTILDADLVRHTGWGAHITTSH